MPRPKSDTVVYFPHYANASSSGDTVKVLQSRFGNDGYAFWFKLLEKLASADGHYLDCRNPRRWQVLLADMGVDDKTGVEIMVLLVEMEAIDKELWESKVIWCQNLVDNLAPVYQNRKRERPQKPVITGENPITTVETVVLVPEKPQRRGEGRRGKDNSNNSNNSNSRGPAKEIDIFVLYEQEIGEITELVRNTLIDAVEFYGEPWVRDAIKEAVRQGRRRWSYVEGILKNWKEEGGREGQGEDEFEIVDAGDIVPDPVAEKIWGKALAELKANVTGANYRTWLENTRAISYKEKVFTLGVPNVNNAEYLNNNQRSLIEKTLIGLTKPGLKVVFKVIKRGESHR